MILKSWSIMFFSRLLVAAKSSQIASINKCAECIDVCSDAAHTLECTELVEHCRISEELFAQMCYIEGANLSAENLIYLAIASSFYLDKVKVIFKDGFPTDLILDNVSKNIQLSINTLIMSVLCTNYTPNEETCRENVTYVHNGKFAIPPPHRRKMLVKYLKISFSCIKNSDLYEPLAMFFEDVTTLDLTANLLEEIPTGALAGLALTKFIISCNRLKALTKNSFRGLTNVTYLDLSTNYIGEISENSFKDMQQLKVIKLDRNYIVNMFSTLFQANNKLSVIGLDENQIGQVTGSVANLLELEEISLEKNRISELPKDFWNHNTRLKAVNFQGNNFCQLPILTLNHGILNLANNKLSKLNLPLTNVKNISKLVISSNCLQITADDKKLQQSEQKVRHLVCWHCCLDNHLASLLVQSVSETVDLRHNSIDKIDTEFLNSVSHLKTVFIGNEMLLRWNFAFAYPKIKHQRKQVAIKSNTSIKISKYSFLDCDIIFVLKLISQPPKNNGSWEVRFELHNVSVGNQTYSDAGSARDDLVKKFEDVNCAFPYHCPVFCDCYVKGLDPAVIISCSGKGLRSFPNLNDFNYPIKLYLSENELTRLPNEGEFDWGIIQELNLDNNALETLNDLALHPNFHALHLKNNKLQIYSPVVESLLTSHATIKILGLSGNPWKCACNPTDMKNLMILSESIIDFENITCISSVSGRLLVLKNLTRNDVCLSSSSTDSLPMAFLTISVILILIGICVSVAYRYRADIRFWLFIKGYCLRFASDDESDADKMYDAFISYSSLDEDWVATHLVPGLENGSPSYTVCIHGRDWPAGELIIDMIYQSLKQSRRTIVVLTDNYVSSEWCRFEFQAAYSQAVTDSLNRVLAVVPNNLPSRSELSNELQAFITLQTYLKWDDVHFWRKLRCSMPRIGPQKVNPSSCDNEVH